MSWLNEVWFLLMHQFPPSVEGGSLENPPAPVGSPEWHQNIDGEMLMMKEWQ